MPVSLISALEFGVCIAYPCSLFKPINTEIIYRWTPYAGLTGIVLT